MILGLQIFSIIFSLIMIYIAYIHYQKGDLSGVEIISWTVVWVVTIFIIVFPEFLQNFAHTFAITRVFDMMIVGGFVLVIPLVYMSFITSKRTEKRLEEFIRKEALKELKKYKNDKR